jgi:hypothetical protein
MSFTKPFAVNVIKKGRDPNCVHFEKITSEQVGTCKKCGRVVDYSVAVGASEQVGFTSQALNTGEYISTWV